MSLTVEELLDAVRLPKSDMDRRVFVQFEDDQGRMEVKNVTVLLKNARQCIDGDRNIAILYLRIEE